jgi:hypothetical protein
MSIPPFTKQDLRHWQKVAIQTHQLPSDVVERLTTGLARGDFPPDQIGLIILILGEGDVRSARPIVERYLTHEEPMVRYNALSALILDWGLDEHRATCIHMLHEDSDEDNRSLAAGCLGSLDEGTHNPETLRLLLQVFCDGSENKYVRRSAYLAILDVVSVPREQRPPSAQEWVWDTDINWKLINELQQKLQLKPGSNNSPPI